MGAIAVSKAEEHQIDRLRKEMMWVALPDHIDQQASTDLMPDDVLIGEQSRLRVQRALADLPADQYQVIVLSYVEGLSHGEIAERLRLSPKTVDAHRANIKSKLALKDGAALVRQSVRWNELQNGHTAPLGA